MADEGEDARDGREGRPEYGERQWMAMIHGCSGVAWGAGQVVVAHAGAAGYDSVAPTREKWRSGEGRGARR